MTAVVDASALVSQFVSTDANHETATAWLRALGDAGHQLVAPSLVLAEVAGSVRRATGFPELARESLGLMLRGSVLELHPVLAPLGSRAAEIAVLTGLKGCDSIYVALAEELGHPLVTFDLEQATRAGQIVRVLPPGEVR